MKKLINTLHAYSVAISFVVVFVIILIFEVRVLNMLILAGVFLCLTAILNAIINFSVFYCALALIMVLICGSIYLSLNHVDGYKILLVIASLLFGLSILYNRNVVKKNSFVVISYAVLLVHYSIVFKSWQFISEISTLIGSN